MAQKVVVDLTEIGNSSQLMVIPFTPFILHTQTMCGPKYVIFIHGIHHGFWWIFDMNGGFGLPIALLEHGTGHPGPEQIDQPMTFYDYILTIR